MGNEKELVKKGNQRRFLAALSKCGNLTTAARIAGVARGRHFFWIRNKDEDYIRAYRRARQSAIELLEEEARRRAYLGIDEPVIHQGQLCKVWRDKRGRVVPEHDPTAVDQIPLTIKRYSDTLLIFLLKGAKPHVYRDKQVEHHGKIDHRHAHLHANAGAIPASVPTELLMEYWRHLDAAEKGETLKAEERQQKALPAPNGESK